MRRWLFFKEKASKAFIQGIGREAEIVEFHNLLTFSQANETIFNERSVQLINSL